MTKLKQPNAPILQRLNRDKRGEKYNVCDRLDVSYTNIKRDGTMVWRDQLVTEAATGSACPQQHQSSTG